MICQVQNLRVDTETDLKIGSDIIKIFILGQPLPINVDLLSLKI
jgi:hypothetical protein